MSAGTEGFDYAQARADFLDAATGAGFEVRSFRHDEPAPDGGALAMDAALKGLDGPDLLVVISGTHGVEGIAGSFIQRRWLREGGSDGSPTAVVLVHALNPYGYAWLSRTNENNVDLNRNAPASFDDAPDAPGYAELHDWLVGGEPESMTEDDVDEKRRAVGEAVLARAVTGGQYSFPDGLFYGGTEAQWSRLRLEELLATLPDHYGRATVIDLHTGLGSFGAAEHIYTGTMADAALEETRARFAPLDVACPDGDRSVSAPVSGPLVNVFKAWRGRKPLAAIALELGLRGFAQTLNALRLSAWQRAHPDCSPALAAEIRRTVEAAFFSPESVWLEAIYRHFRTAVETVLGSMMMEETGERTRR